MKKNIVILVLLVMSSTLGYTQGPPPELRSATIEKKVLKKIKRNVTTSDFMDYVDEGQKESLIVLCYVNNDNVLEVAQIKGKDKELADEVKETLEENPVKIDSNKKGEIYRFKLTFEHRPGL
ncbi:hypothetical protein KQH26_00195 [bacterium]|nr:hypothetical protein [bacterium]